MDQEREDYADNDLSPKRPTSPSVTILQLIILTVIGSLTVFAIFMRWVHYDF